MESVRKKVIELKENCEKIIDIIDNKQQKYERESEKMLDLSKLTRRNAELNFEINKDLLEISCKIVVKDYLYEEN